ncbi:hypothetical protein SLS53_005623 [Cytospora paraplurivora]|uniref:DUF7924 domain-containing protein n=1 Tax=Cytospora paraplurivora TaxID=2898453 RepID=A0AAN9U5C9_9PEZI
MAPKRDKGKSKEVTKRSGPYDPNYEQYLNDHDTWFASADDGTKPDNYDYTIQRLEVPSSPDLLTELSDQHKDFIKKNDTGSQETLFDSVIPTIQGPSDGLYARNRRFYNMRLGDTISDAQPDYYEGVHPKDIHAEVKRTLSKRIIPTNARGTKDPAAPNYFFEAKAPNQYTEDARMQAGIAGVLGARGLHSLQNYCKGTKKPVYDGNAYTFSVTYVKFELTIYATYLTAPSQDIDRPQYTVTEINQYWLKNKSLFLEGVTACRNLRNLAREFREKFVNEANERVKKPTRQTRSTHATGDLPDLSEEDHPSTEGPTNLGTDLGPDSNDGMSSRESSAFESWTSRLRGRRRRGAAPDELPRKKPGRKGRG